RTLDVRTAARRNGAVWGPRLVEQTSQTLRARVSHALAARPIHQAGLFGIARTPLETEGGTRRRRPHAEIRDASWIRSRLRRVVLEHHPRCLRDLLVATLRLVGRADVTAGEAPPHDRACPRVGDVDEGRSHQNRLNARPPPPVCAETDGPPRVGRPGDL